MRDVAREAGVSTGAVSRILRNMPGFKPETVRRVWATAEALGYGRTPGIAGDSGGASNKPLKIGVFHAYPQDMDKNRPYYQAIRNGIELESAAHNIELVQVFWTDHPKPLATNGELHGAIYLGSASWPWISGAAAIEEFSSSLITQAMVFIGASPDPPALCLYRVGFRRRDRGCTPSSVGTGSYKDWVYWVLRFPPRWSVNHLSSDLAGGKQLRQKPRVRDTRFSSGRGKGGNPSNSRTASLAYRVFCWSRFFSARSSFCATRTEHPHPGRDIPYLLRQR